MFAVFNVHRQSASMNAILTECHRLPPPVVACDLGFYLFVEGLIFQFTRNYWELVLRRFSARSGGSRIGNDGGFSEFLGPRPGFDECTVLTPTLSTTEYTRIITNTGV